MRATGLDQQFVRALAPWRRPLSSHDPGKILLDLALMLALGGDCLADVASLQAEPEVYGPVASDPTVSRLLRVLAATLILLSERSPRRAEPRGRGRGTSPEITHRATGRPQRIRWSSIWMRRW